MSKGQPVLFCRFNETKDYSTGLRTGGRIGKQPVLRPITKGFMLRSARLLLRSNLPSSR